MLSENQAHLENLKNLSFDEMELTVGGACSPHKRAIAACCAVGAVFMPALAIGCIGYAYYCGL